MTAGDPAPLLLRFMLPMLIGNIFQQFYNLVDTMVVGKFVDADALAAVGSTGSITNLFFCLCNGLSAGIGIIVSQFFGAGREQKVRRAITNAFYIMTVTGLVMGGLGALLARPVLSALHTPENILGNAVLYMQITCAGVLGTALYNVMAAILRGIGDSKTPLYFLIISSFLNIGMDLLFVIVFGWGVPGVAGATVVAQLLSAAASAGYAFLRNPMFRFSRAEWRFDPEITGECFRIGLPMAVQSGMMAFSFVILQRVINGFGSVIVAAFTTTSRIETVVNQPFRSLGDSMSTYAGQNVGAGKYDRVSEGYRKAMVMMAVFAFVMLPVMWFFGRFFMTLFVNEAEVIALGGIALRILALFYIPLGMIYVCRGILNGSGDAKFSLISGIAEMSGRILFPGPLSMIPAIGFWGIWIGTGLTWTVVGLTAFIRYRSGVWSRAAKKRKLLSDAK
ncbi:MAG: MATE family efflux transporter [Lachnospiraceae bacterium]|nr:MATE family efflux transporter [Lachnospiraceae bacterium]